jgi:predicted cupin superfamily sugar epimerase
MLYLTINFIIKKKDENKISKEKTYPKKIRPISTLIYYLLVGTQYSAIHRVKSDEIWHFYLGSPVTIHIINDEHISPRVQLGNNLENDDNIHYVVTKDTWFCAEINDKTSFALMGCTVSPGFDYEDFELDITSLDRYDSVKYPPSWICFSNFNFLIINSAFIIKRT